MPGALSSECVCFILSNFTQEKRPLWPPNSLGANECSQAESSTAWLWERRVLDPGCGIQGHGKDSALHFKSASDFYILKNENKLWEFLGSPVVKTQCFHCWGLGSIPGRGTKTLYVVWHGPKQTNKNPAKLARSSVSKRDLKGMV